MNVLVDGTFLFPARFLFYVRSAITCGTWSKQQRGSCMILPVPDDQDDVLDDGKEDDNKDVRLCRLRSCRSSCAVRFT